MLTIEDIKKEVLPLPEEERGKKVREILERYKVPEELPCEVIKKMESLGFLDYTYPVEYIKEGSQKILADQDESYVIQRDDPEFMEEIKRDASSTVMRNNRFILNYCDDEFTKELMERGVPVPMEESR